MTSQKIKNTQQQTLKNNIVSGICIVSGLLTFTGMFSGTKYERLEICFKPEISKDFCRDDQKYLVLSKPGTDSDTVPSNPIYNGFNNFVIPSEARVNRIVKPTNPNYLGYGIAGTILFCTGLGMFNLRTNKNLRNFPIYFEEHKTEIFSNSLKGLLARESTKLDLDIIRKSKEDEHSRVLEAISSLREQEYVDSLTPSQIEGVRKDLEMQEELKQLQFQTQIAAMEEQKARHVHGAEKARYDTMQLNIKTQTTVNEDFDHPEIDGVKWFDFEIISDNYDSFPHIRIVGATGTGKTLLADYLLQYLPGTNEVITTKRMPWQWTIGGEKKVIGVPEKWNEIEGVIMALQGDRVNRLHMASEGHDMDEMIRNIVVDEWRAINSHIPKAKNVVRDTLTLAREARIRLVLMAQGRQVVTWGLEGESDLEECMSSFYIGDFARQEARLYYKENEKYIDENIPSKVLQYLEDKGNRALWVHSGIGDFPGVIPEFELPKKIKKPKTSDVDK